MRILFAIQGTGNGHLSRARDVYPELCRYGEVDVLISGYQADVEVPFPVKYRPYGMSFIFGKKGGVDIWGTARKLKLPTCIRDARGLDIRGYDLVVNDFEPISAWAARLAGVPCVSLSHQWAVLHPGAPKPAGWNVMGQSILRHYAPCKRGYGFHFKAYGEHIYTPVIRHEVRELQTADNGHITVYLPSYDDDTMLQYFRQFRELRWEIFSKHTKTERKEGNVYIRPISNQAFLSSMASSTGVLCGAGFEGPAEALYLGKKLLVVPMLGQYEQQCNAAALEQMGVPAIKRLHPKYMSRISFWLSDYSQRVQVNYPDQTAAIVDKMMLDFSQARQAEPVAPLSAGA